MIKRGMNVLMAATLSLTMIGCVAQGVADEQLTSNRTKDGQIADLKARLEEKDAEIAMLKAQANRPDPDLLAKLEQAQADRQRLETELAELLVKMRNLPGGPLPTDIDRALVQLAASNPGLMTYDPKLGMVRFASDLTFALGSANVNQGAVGSLNQLASILNSPAARPYEVRVVGHTDNVPINRTRDQHPTNWHLSVHRAIAVKDVLQRAGVSPSRMAIGGYGEYRPVVANGPRGAQANRRVEIYLVPMAETSPVQPAPAPEGLETPRPRPAPEQPEQPELFK